MQIQLRIATLVKRLCKSRKIWVKKNKWIKSNLVKLNDLKQQKSEEPQKNKWINKRNKTKNNITLLFLKYNHVMIMYNALKNYYYYYYCMYMRHQQQIKTKKKWKHTNIPNLASGFLLIVLMLHIPIRWIPLFLLSSLNLSNILQQHTSVCGLCFCSWNWMAVNIIFFVFFSQVNCLFCIIY